MSDQTSTTEVVEAPVAVVSAPVVDEAAEIAAAIAKQIATAPVVSAPVAPVATKERSKFIDATDPFAVRWGIKNDKGQYVSAQYLSAYVQCSCRLPEYSDQPGFTRKQAFEYFRSDAFLETVKGCDAATIGKIAASDPRWNRPVTTKKPKAPATKPATPAAPAVVAVPAAPIVTVDDPEAMAFAQNMAQAEAALQAANIAAALDAQALVASVEKQPKPIEEQPEPVKDPATAIEDSKAARRAARQNARK